MQKFEEIKFVDKNYVIEIGSDVFIGMNVTILDGIKIGHDGQGTQSQLQFLPEKHTDFIFVVLAEEFGMIGALFLLFLYFLLIAYGFMIALTCRNQFGRLAAFGLTVSFFLYVFVNVAMVTGTIPVVGIPLPLVS